MANYIRALYERNADSPDAGPIRFVASAAGVKRDGLSLNASDWDLSNYQNNPVVLWGHDYWGTNLPIGRADVEIDLPGNRLMADITFDPDDEFAQKIERKYRNGYLNTVSVGWDNHGERNELLDISAVPVPGDPDALIERQIRGLASIGEKLIELTEEPDTPKGDDAESVWQGTALRMARLFVNAAGDDAFDDKEYRKLCRVYERLGKTPPETHEHVEALGMAELRGLFVAGEPDMLPELFREQESEPVVDDALARLHAIMTGAK